jgi:RimJ/RimL family protein N-acetyltransferase
MNKQWISESKRIALRPMGESDAHTVCEYRSMPDVSIFQGWTPETPQEVSDYAQKMAQREPFHVGEWYQIVIEHKIDDCVIGDIAVCIEPESGLQAELGIALNPQYQRKGLAYETVILLCDYLFTEKSLHRIYVSIDPRNSASLGLMKKIGFRQEAHHLQSFYFKGEWCDDIIMAMLSQEWPHR